MSSKKHKPRRRLSSHDRIVAKGICHKSKVRNPVQFAWELFSELKTKHGDKLTRKLALEVAFKRGLAYYTARTQWQEWSAAGRRDQARTNQHATKTY